LLVSQLIWLVIRYFTDFLVFVVLPFVYGDVDRWLNQMIGPVPDRFDTVTDEIGLVFPWYSVLLGFDLEM
jgi:hypothetical protein